MEKFMDDDLLLSEGTAVRAVGKKKFMDDNFLLSTDTAVTLYQDRKSVV